MRWKEGAGIGGEEGEWEANPTFALVCGVGGQGVPIEAGAAAVAVEASRVVDALETLPTQPVAVAHSIGVNVAIAAALAAQSHWARLAQGVPEIAVVT